MSFTVFRLISLLLYGFPVTGISSGEPYQQRMPLSQRLPAGYRAESIQQRHVSGKISLMDSLTIGTHSSLSRDSQYVTKDDISPTHIDNEK